ncbi:MAG TPA: acetyltransferase, partial [Spirochaetota bacterium]
KDLEITRRACAKFGNVPVAVMNFLEGTRFTKEKHSRQKSPYKNLLMPKAGGAAYVLSIMGKQLDGILNVTIIYPDGDSGFWSFLCGKVERIRVVVERIPVTKNILGDYAADEKYQTRFRNWVNKLWKTKDQLMTKELTPRAAAKKTVRRKKNPPTE